MQSSSMRNRTPFLLSGMLFLLSSQGCIATRGWVTEQLVPLNERLAQTESRLGQTEAKADSALDRLDHLQLERRFVLNLKNEANFSPGSNALTSEAKKQIDGFLSDLDRTDDKTFLVAGYTDSSGSEAYNYALGQRRATSVAGYLISHKGIDPLRVTAVSYGKNDPRADNATREGRSKNRRVEISVYKEVIAPTLEEKMATR